MRTRTTWIGDYGISDNEAKRLYELCKKPNKEITDKIIQIAYEVNEGIATSLILSLIGGLSYEKIEMYVGLTHVLKEDFYGYRRKCIAKLNEYLEGENG